MIEPCTSAAPNSVFRAAFKTTGDSLLHYYRKDEVFWGIPIAGGHDSFMVKWGVRPGEWVDAFTADLHRIRWQYRRNP